MPDTEPRSCGNCLYWWGWEDGGEQCMGECRRYPPVVVEVTNDGDIVQNSPDTHKDYLCGEHKRCED